MRGGDPRSAAPVIRKLRSRLALRAVEPAAQQERCEPVVIRSWSATYVEGVRPISREDLSGVIVTAGDN